MHSISWNNIDIEPYSFFNLISIISNNAFARRTIAEFVSDKANMSYAFRFFKMAKLMKSENLLTWRWNFTKTKIKISCWHRSRLINILEEISPTLREFEDPEKMIDLYKKCLRNLFIEVFLVKKNSNKNNNWKKAYFEQNLFRTQIRPGQSPQNFCNFYRRILNEFKFFNSY